MDKATITFLKREIKKVLPVFVIAVLGGLLIFGKMYLSLRDHQLDGLLTFAYMYDFWIDEAGDMFLGYLLQDTISVFAIALEVILILRIFILENRTDISDFLRILPIKEWKKTWIKVGVGEGVNAVLCILFGIVGTAVYAVLGTGIEEINRMIPVGTTPTNSLVVLWQFVFIMFCAMSAVFLILFAVQLCVHHRGLALFIGGGILVTPFFYTIAYPLLVEPGMKNSGMMPMITGSIVNFFPDCDFFSPEYSDLTKRLIYWTGYTEKVLFLLILMAAALVVIALALHFRWNIQESNNLVINSKPVMEFILTGISLSAGVGMSLVFGDIVVGINHPLERFSTWIIIVIMTGFLLLIENIIVEIMQRKQKGV